MIKTNCTNKTKNGLEIVLSGVSYNKACYWLESETSKHGVKIESIKHDFKLGHDIIKTETRTFYYSETDGILYGE